MWKTRIGGILRLAALVVITIVVWCYAWDRMSAENWGAPVDYQGDAPQIMGWIKAASEGDYIPFWTETIHRLGAPYTANWNDYPMYEKILTFGLGMVTRCFGIFWTANFSMVFAHVLSAISFYLCCRFLRHSRTWSFVGALLFSFTYYNFFRNISHVLLAYSYTLPWAILSTWIIIASKRMRLGDRLSWVCLVTGFVMGLSNPYWLNMYFQLMIFSLIAQFFKQRRLENLKVGFYSLALAAAGFVACNMATLAYEWAHGKNPNALDRHYFESEFYALKPMEFFIPPPNHNVQGLADIGSKYVSGVFVHGEICSPYLGLFGIVGLLWIFAEGFVWIARNRKRAKPFPPHTLQILWVVLYCAVGGFNCLISLSGIQLFRGSNRYSMFVSTIVLLFLTSRISRLSRKWSPAPNLLLAAVVLLVGTFDEMPRPKAPSETIAGLKVINSDRAFGAKMEEKIPSGSMVFQMPVMSFPEAVPIHDLTGYEMMRPYLVTKTLRFSFGSVRGRTREQWQWEVEKLPVPQMVAELEKYGFAAIYINRKGYADHGEDLLKQLAAAGRDQIFEDDAREQLCVMLKPSASPELPHTDDRAQIVFKSGWAVTEHSFLENREWSSGNATLTFFSEASLPTSYNFRCLIGSIASRRVAIEMDGHQLWSAEVPAGQAVPVDISVVGRHGNNKVTLTTDAPPTHTKDTPLPLAFTLVNVQITKILGTEIPRGFTHAALILTKMKKSAK